MDLKEFSGKGYGDLHLCNAELYLAAAKEDYSPPPIPIELPEFADLKAKPPKFGDDLKKHFYLSEEFTFLNHGFVGAVIKESLGVSQAYERYVDTQPVRAFNRELVPLLCHVRREMAEFVGCEAQDLFLAENATTGISTILRSLTFTNEDKILTLSVGYGAVGFAVDLICERTGAQHMNVQLNPPFTHPQKIVDVVSDSLCDGIKLAIFDHIPSNASIILPIQEMTELCQKRGILVLIDGAHGLGQVELFIPSYGADFYVANCHKWLSNTRGSAFGYVKRDRQHLIRPLVTTWGHGRGFSAEFVWSGTQYYSPHVALLSTLRFWNSIGSDVIRKYCSDTVKQAAKLCRDAWNVEPFCPDDMIGTMALVELPARLNDPDWKPEGVKKDIITDCLYFVHKIEVPVRAVAGTLYVRLSCFVYNQMSDYEKLCSAVLEICDKRDSLINYNAKFPVSW